MAKKRTSWLKLYDRSGTFIASFRHAEDAALVATNYGGSTIRDGHLKKRTLWTEGNEVTTGGESADQCARIIYDRLDAMRLEDDRRNAARPVLSGSAMYPGRYFSKSTTPPTTNTLNRLRDPQAVAIGRRLAHLTSNQQEHESLHD